MKKIFGLVIYVYLLSMQAFATGNFSDNLTVPHTFASGETISSNKMNENFNKIFEELNKFKKYIYSDGDIIAEFISFNNSDAFGLNEKNFWFRINLSSGTLKYYDPNMNGLYYTSTDCTGDIYIKNQYLFINEVFNMYYWDSSTNSYNETPYYTSNDYYDIIYKSNKWGLDGSCQSANNTSEETFIKIYQNISTVTGINSSFFQPPITIDSK